MKTTICTISCTNYLPKAITLAKSIKRHHNGIPVSLCLVEREIPDNVKLQQHFDEIVLARDIFGEYFEWQIFKYDQLEGSTFIKATFLKHLIERYERVIYLDPDICVYSPLVELFDLSHDIILTPHQIFPTSDLKIIDSTVIGFLMCGIFNLGFICVKNSKDTRTFLDWWEHKLKFYAFVDFQRGLFTDQKWMDLAFSLFEILSLKHCGYNVANWNINERQLSETATKNVLVNNCTPLRFFHFSSVDTGKDLRIFRLMAPTESFEVVRRLRRQYKQAIKDNDQQGLSRLDWTYNYFDSGERVSNLSRVAFFKNRELRQRLRNPFESSNEEILSIGY